jgi:phenylalanine ammonia-lyase
METIKPGSGDRERASYSEPDGLSEKEVEIRGCGLSIEEVVRVACCGASVRLSRDEDIMEAIRASEKYIRNAVKIGEPIYGVTSGFGGMAHVVVPVKEAVALQNNLPRFHKVAAGKRLPDADVRATMLLRANSLMRGVSGVRFELIRRLEVFLNAGVIPHIYDLGSIGASGDLTPLAYLTGALVGLDRCYKVTWKNEEMDAVTLLKRLGLPRMELYPKEGLAIMNGTSVMAGIAALAVDKARTLLALAMGAHALFIQALHGTNQSFHPFIHRHKAHPGQVWSAAHMLDLLVGSRLIRDEMHGRSNYRTKDLIQDRYSLRCLPQYMGPIVDGLEQIARQVETECNAATDNPLIDVKNQAGYHCGNFLGQYIGTSMDHLRYYMGLLAKHLDTQIALLVAPEFSNGLPGSLVGNPERTYNMGLKGLQITGNSIMPLLSFYGNSLVDRFPTHAEQFNQNINSQGFGSANLARQTIQLLQQYLAIALMFGVQAVDLRTHKEAGHYDARSYLSQATQRLYDVLREVVEKPPCKEEPYVRNDDEQALDEHIRRIAADIESGGRIPRAVRQTLSSLKAHTAVSFTGEVKKEPVETTGIDWGDYTKMNIAQCLETGRRKYPERIALVFEEQSYTYKELDEAANRVANGLTAMGVESGDRVALFLPNIPAFVFAYHGIQKMGGVAVSVNNTLKSDEVTYILNDSGASVVFTTAQLRENVKEEHLTALRTVVVVEGESGPDCTLEDVTARVSSDADALEMEQDAPAAIVYSSGTGGFPKGVVLSHGNVISNMQAKKRHLDIRADDRLLLFLPLFHCFGQNAVLNSGLGAGATILLHRQFDPHRTRTAILEDGVTMFFGVLTTYVLMHDRLDAGETGALRYCFSAATPLPVEVARKWQDKYGLFIHQGYGLTETSPFASYNHSTMPKLGSVGTPIEHVEMGVVDIDGGHRLGPGEVGEIIIRGPNVMLGYWNRPAETAEVLKGGWFHTGDIGKMDYEGYFYLVDRLRDLINVGGLKVYPAEVETVLEEHPAVKEAAVYGVTDALMAEQVRAAVVLETGQSIAPEELIAFGLKRIANFKVPGGIDFVYTIPRNPTGKVLRRVLKQQYETAGNGSAVVGSAAPRVRTAQSIQNWIKEWMSRQLGIDADGIDNRKAFTDYGMTSTQNVKMTQALGVWLGIGLEVVLAWRYTTIDTMARYLTERLNAGTRKPGEKCSFAEYVPYAKQQTETDDAVGLWPSVAEFFVYDEYLYNALTNDRLRNQKYKAAINKHVPGKVVVEIGTGKDAILSRFCVEAGAQKVYAVERCADTAKQAADRVKELGMSGQIEIIHGDAMKVELPQPADVCVSEIVGSIGGSEGAAVIINNAWRFLKPGGVMLPARSITKIAPVTFPDQLRNDLGFTKLSGHYVREIFKQVGYPFDLRVCIKNFPLSHVLSQPGEFEDLDFTKPIPLEYSIENRLTVEKQGRLDGFLVWLTLHTTAGEEIDILENRHSWLPIYFPVFSPGILVMPGDIIEVTCSGTLCENKLNPDYRLKGKLHPKGGKDDSFEYDAWHHRAVFKQTPFYRRLFGGPEPGEKQGTNIDAEGRSEVQWANMLTNVLDSIKQKENR